MNKKIKVIELFNRVYNKENLPKRVKYKGEIFKLVRWNNEMFYHNKEGSMIKKVLYFCNLEDEVEILEDEEIEEIKVDDNNYIVTDNGTNLKGRSIDITFVNKINEIIDKVNKLDKKINKEE